MKWPWTKPEPEPEPEIKRHMVRIHLTENAPSIEGILMSDVADHYCLVNAKAFENDGRSLSLEGETWVPRARVIFLQVIS